MLLLTLRFILEQKLSNSNILSASNQLSQIPIKNYFAKKNIKFHIQNERKSYEKKFHLFSNNNGKCYVEKLL
jgi:hypothetical protein